MATSSLLVHESRRLKINGNVFARRLFVFDVWCWEHTQRLLCNVGSGPDGRWLPPASRRGRLAVPRNTVRGGERVSLVILFTPFYSSWLTLPSGYSMEYI